MAVGITWTSGQAVYADRDDSNGRAMEIEPVPVSETEKDDREHFISDYHIPEQKPVESMSSYGKNCFYLNRGTEDIPSRWDWSKISSYMPSLRNQNPFGSCWAQAAMTMAEISLMKKGLASSPNLSEVQLAYYSYNWETDPLGGTEGDDNRGLFTDTTYLDNGGSLNFAKNILASWTGVAADAGELAYPKKRQT